MSSGVQKFLEKLSTELSTPAAQKAAEKGSDGKTYTFYFAEGTEIDFIDLYPGVEMRGAIAVCPVGKREDLFLYLMRANLLGQGTGGARIGLDENEKNLTLSLGLPYEMEYRAFKEAFEEFANHLVYWRDVVAKFEKNETM
ncbi:MAG TPA: type III secretion system chaperone [Chlamydiales bacterium]|nr:type III secretion system chaperone [Chlamydiales bacterium]